MLLAERKLPVLSSDARELIWAAETFVFEGTPSELLHPNLERRMCFPNETVMPVLELPVVARTAVVTGALARSFAAACIEGWRNDSYITKVSKPHAYIDLLRVGQRITKRGHESKLTLDEHSDKINAHVAALIVFNNFEDLCSESFGWKQLEKLQPALEHGETVADRSKEIAAQSDLRKYRWKTIRPAALATLSATGIAIEAAGLIGEKGNIPFLGFVGSIALLKAFNNNKVTKTLKQRVKDSKIKS